MISVLIPVFNSSVVMLVSELQQQLSAAEIPYEIIVVDDCSTVFLKNINRVIQEYQHVNYLELPHNIGRIAVRNLLSKKAVFNWLLFLDADSVIVSTQFIKAYLEAVIANVDVIVGGRIYDKKKPADCRLSLHWTYGSQRECQLPEQRNKHLRAGFMSNNFLIKKDIFFKLQITEVLAGYGHEDTWMGIQLENIGASVQNISNPVLHNGIEESHVFINKSLNALKNLHTLQKLVGEETLKNHVKLYAVYYSCKKWGVLPLLKIGVTMLQPIIMKNLHSCHPSLRLFDVYRLNYFACLNRTGTS